VLPFWLTVVVLSRDLLLILVAVLIMLTGGRIHPAPTRLGKTSTAFQMVTVGIALLGAAVDGDLGRLREGLVLATAALTVGSGLQYLRLAPRYVDWGGR
jgi:cardiolipin synthase